MTPQNYSESGLEEILADPGPEFVPTARQIYANSPGAWTDEDLAKAGRKRQEPKGTLPPHILAMIQEMGAHNSAISDNVQISQTPDQPDLQDQ
jgi:hypothetical protein